jgi:hypothetical protein
MKRSLALAVLTIAFTALSSRSYAGTIVDVQFGCTTATTTTCQVNGAASPNNTLPQTGAAVIGSANDIWNLVSPASAFTGFGSASALLDTNGNATSDSVSWTSTGEFTRGLPQDASGFDGTAYQNLMSGYLYEGGTGSIDISGLAAGLEYQLYIYTQGDLGGANGRQTTFTVNGGSPFATNGGIGSLPTFLFGTNYVSFDVAADGGGNINVVYSNAAGEADVNGFQLSSTPEPGTFGLVIGAFGVGAAWMRKRSVRS